MREALYMKFLYILESKLRFSQTVLKPIFGVLSTELNTTRHYIKENIGKINLFYNTHKLKKGEDGVRKASNVFMLRYVCVHQDLPLANIFTLLSVMFCAFPDRDYCVMSIPKSASIQRSNLEALKYFMASNLQ